MEASGIALWEDPAVHRRRWAILGILCFSLALIGIDVTVVIVAVPDLIEELGADASSLQWITAAYSLTFAGLVVAMGAISDRYGRKRVLAIGLVLFGVMSALGAFARTPEELIAARALLGVAAAMIMPGTLSIVATVFGPDERQQAVGIWSGVAGIGFILGPVVGGLLLTHFWWGSILLVNVPVVVLALLGNTIIPESRDPNRTPIDVTGVVLSIVALVAFVFALIEAPGSGWLSARILAAFAIAVVAGTAFVIVERRARHPMLDVELFRLPAFTIPVLVITWGFLVIYGVDYLVPLYLRFVDGSSPLVSGLILAPGAIAWSIVAPFTPRMSVRFGQRIVMVTGILIVALSCVLLMVAGAESGTTQLLIVTVSSAMAGLGMGTAVTPATNLLLDAVPPDKAGVASAMNDVTREVGGAIGIAVIGTLLASLYGPRMQTATVGLGLGERADKVVDNIGDATAVARDLPERTAGPLLDAAQGAFVGGQRLALAVCAVVLVLLAVVAAVALKDRPGVASSAADKVPAPPGLSGNATPTPATTSPYEL